MAERLRASPLARRLAREAGIELAQLSGSGPAGRIVVRDLPAEARTAEAAASRSSAAATAGAPAQAPAADPAPAAAGPTPEVAGVPVTYTLARSVPARTFLLFLEEFSRRAPQRTGHLLCRAADAARSETGALPGPGAALLDPETMDVAGASALAICDLMQSGLDRAMLPVVAPGAATLSVAGPGPESAEPRLSLVLTVDAAALSPRRGAAFLAAMAERILHPAELFV
ncbi:E3 binding domain-containing protein [Roseivivax sp. CAU 1761]